jgi:hypothetical protein
MAGRLKLRLFFEWGGGVLWCANGEARTRFDVGPAEEKLGLSRTLLHRMTEMTALHDTALDWDDPTGPSPWTEEQYASFHQAVQELAEEVALELGPEFELEIGPLDSGNQKNEPLAR